MAMGGTHLQNTFHSHRCHKDGSSNDKRSESETFTQREGGRCYRREETANYIFVQGTGFGRKSNGCETRAGIYGERDP